MDLKTLRDRGAFVPETPVAREVTWMHADENGEQVTDTFTVHVVRHSAGAIERLRSELLRDQSRLWEFLLISASLRLGDDASERLTYDEACALEPGLARILADAIVSVNNVGGPSAKN
jgi:hypothetical protein